MNQPTFHVVIPCQGYKEAEKRAAHERERWASEQVTIYIEPGF